MRDAFANRLLELAREDPSIELLTGDLGFGVLAPFQKEFPDRFHNVGIAEQLMIEMATGMAMAGKKVVCYSIGNFPVLRCLEQTRNDAAYGGQNVKIVEVGGGFTYGQLGMSHNALEDLAAVLPIPGLSVYTPADKAEAILATDLMLERNGTALLRLERPSENAIHTSPSLANYKLGTALPVVCGRDAAILAYGGVAVHAERAAKALGCSCYTFPVLKPLDVTAVRTELSKYRFLCVVEEHSKHGGLGSIIESLFAPQSNAPRILKLGAPDEYLGMIGTQDFMRSQIGIDEATIIQTIRSLLEEGDK